MTKDGRSDVERSESARRDVQFIAGGGEAGALVRSMDWRRTLLGPVEDWPQSLRSSVSICLNSRFPIALFWGPEFAMLYNDGLLPMVGAKKQAMGQPALEVLAEIRDVIEPLLRHVATTGEATWSEDLMLPLVREDAPEEAYFTFTYSPIRKEDGEIGGVFCAAIETTENVIEGRRLRLLNALAQASQARTPAEACAHAATTLATSPHDLPFALLYLLDESTGVATLAGAAHVEPGAPRAPLSIAAGDRSTWPLDDARTEGGPVLVPLDSGPEGARAAVILPIERAGRARPFGFVVAGLAPLLRGSESYHRFHTLLAASISRAVSSASAFDEERKRSEALAELDRAKTTFFSNVSHEFRTPLTLLLGPASDALSDADLTPRDRERWRLVHGNAQRLQKLVSTLLDFSRVEAGRMQACYRPTDLASLTADLASTFRAAFERAGVAFEVECPPLASVVYVDHDMWEKVVLNLLSNALKFTYEGTVSVRLREEGDRVALVVRDTGTGIARDELPHVFERFHRVEGARARTHEGSGIGLALVQELVRLHGGTIGVASVKNEGTAFTVAIPKGLAHLPADRVEEGATPIIASANAYVNEALRWLPGASRNSESPYATTENGSPLALPHHVNGRILVADDNADMREYVARILDEHWTVDTVADGEAARRIMAKRRYDLVLTDVMMPGIDGFALLEAIRSDPETAELPVVVLSARAGEESRIDGLRAGADDYLVKPFSARELVARVSTHIALGKARATMHAAVTEQVRLRESVELARQDLERALARAEASEAQYRELIDNLPELAWNARPDGHIDFYNRRWYDYTGTTLEQMNGWGWKAVHDPEVLPKVVERWQRSLATGEAFEMEFPLRGKGGTFRWFLTRVRPLRDSAGSIVRWFGTNTDVHHQREAMLKAEEASLAKDEFLATASHELRTPLNAILGWARLLRAGQLDPSGYLRAVETIERNAKSQVRLVEDILDGSRIITGKLHLEIRPLDMTTLVSAAMDAVRPAAEAKSISVSVAVDPAAARIVGDPERLQQVVWNLANNAIKFTPKGGSVDVRLERVDTSIQLTVTDSGQGIGNDFLPHVFERFRQAEGSTTRRHGGLGLGLALVRHLVEAHGGTVRAESDGTDRGSRFIVLLPVQAVYEEKRADLRPVVVASHEESTPGRLNGVTILVVDDEADARDLVATVLRAYGAEVTTAANANDGLELLAKTTPMILISDIGMPVTDGYALIRRVRTSTGARGAQIPAIALTAYAREEDRRLALEAGFQTHVAKPVEPAELVRVVTGIVQYVSAQSSLTARDTALDRADTFLKFEKLLGSQGVHEALRFLNSRTPHRFTGIYRFDPPVLRNLHLVDSYAPKLEKGDDAPMAETYCSIVGETERSFTTEDARQDDRLRTHPAREDVISYCGVLLRDGDGKPYGTLCHFDLVPCEIPLAEMPLLEAAAPYLMRALARLPPASRPR